MPAKAPLSAGLQSITTHGNQLSYTTSAALRDACRANRDSESIDSGTSSKMEELVTSVPQLHNLEHLLKAERAAAEAADAVEAELEHELRLLRGRAAEDEAAAAAEHTEVNAEAEEAASTHRALSAQLEAEEASYESARERMDLEIAELVARRSQLERLDKSPNSPARRARLRKSASEGTSPEPEPPALDANLELLLQKEEELTARFDAEERRESSANEVLMWAERQLAALDAAAASHAASKKTSKAKGTAKRAGKR